MTEDEARRVVLLEAHENPPGSGWNADDTRWATRQALATLGEGATPERFVATRAALAMPRLAERTPAAARWLARRGWHPAFVALAVGAGFALGLAADQLGAPARVNLLAPAVWAVVAWNGLVYVGLLLPWHRPLAGLRAGLAGWVGGAGAGRDGPLARAAERWRALAAPLAASRAALLLHAAAAALGAGLVAGLYLRGLVWDYRAGWESTFLSPAQVQALLDALLAPAAALSGVPVPAVAPLQLGPGAAADATAAPWIHLYALTLALAVIGPRLALALFAAAQARSRAARLALPLATPYFEALHPLMRPGLPRALRLAWATAAGAELELFGRAVPARLDAPLALVETEDGEVLQLVPPPAAAGAGLPAVGTAHPQPWWRRWLDGPDGAAADPAGNARAACDAVLWVGAPGDARPAWLPPLAAAGRPVVVLDPGHRADAQPADADADASAHALPLAARDDGWLPEGRLLAVLAAALGPDPRLARLDAAWRRQQRARLDALLAETAASLAHIARERVPLADPGWRVWRSEAEAEAARAALVAALEAEWRAGAERLAALTGPGAPAGADAPSADSPGADPAALSARRRGFGEKRAALAGGVLSGALLGLKADVLAGGLTMGAGAVVGAVLGALGGAGMARGLNVVRDGGPPAVEWDAAALEAIAQALLRRVAVGALGRDAARLDARLAPALAARRAAFAAVLAQRGRAAPAASEAAGLAARLRPLLEAALVEALGGEPAAAGPRPAATAGAGGPGTP